MAEFESVHAQCNKLETDEDEVLTGAVCKKSKGHDRAANKDPRRRAHFDPSRDRVWEVKNGRCVPLDPR